MLAEQTPEAPFEEPSAWDQKEMPFTEHLRELRNRLMVSLITISVLAVAMFWPSQFMITWLKNEYLGHNIQLHAFAPTDVIFTEFKFSIYAAIVLGLPVLVYQAWMFIVPAFHPRTRRIVYAYTLPSLFLAAAGIAFCHFFIIHKVLTALLAITNTVAQETFGIEPTLNIILLTFLAFALVFQTPMIMVALARIGVVNSAMLRKYRRYAGMGILLVGGVAAPDASPVTMLLIAAPMYVLYEASIWIILILERSWRREAGRA
ncbi:MAG TPA: twin-arginine translocase subunit TatC [Candidatus Baltobacteraceae bacterium]|nr:twin-arginine translocase subunit TatC [Candidatus Baltobacteraceae bacterium]